MVGAVAGGAMGGKALEAKGKALESAVEQAEEAIIRSAEGLADLELAAEDTGWMELTNRADAWTFSRSALRSMMSLSRLMYLFNPLIRRAVTVQELYVWGSGCHIKADDERVDEVLHDFFEDEKNQPIIGDGWPEREREQRIDGNTFFMLFRNKKTGACRIRILPVDMCEEIICNPDDLKEPWFYRQSMSYVYQDGMKSKSEEAVYYPDINYNPKTKPTEIGGIDVDWDVCILHVKTGGLSTMKFGMPELYSSIPWATAYKKILENFATILAAHARLAMQISGLNKKKLAATKNKLQSTVNSGEILEKNPSAATASWFLASGNADVKPIKTAGSTTGPDEARALRSMVAAGSDTPEHFFGDSDIGNYATSSTLDRPTELKMVSRQKMWSNVIRRLGAKIIEWSAVAPEGKLRDAGFKVKPTRDYFDGTQVMTVTSPKNQSLRWTIDFPSIIEREIVERVRAVVQAATLNGSPAEGIIRDRRQLYKMLMIALGQKDVDGLVDMYYPKEEIQGYIDPAQKIKNETLDAQGKKALGDAALKNADASMITAKKPTPKPVAPKAAPAKKGV